jgi:hypothetical protein
MGGGMIGVWGLENQVGFDWQCNALLSLPDFALQVLS